MTMFVRQAFFTVLLFSCVSFSDHPRDQLNPNKESARPLIAQPEAHPDLWLVGYKRSVPRSVMTRVHRAAGVKVVHTFKALAVDVVRMTEEDPDRRAAQIASYRSRPEIRYIEPNYRLTKSMLPNDPGFASLWGLHNTGQDGGAPGADIAVTHVWATYGTGSTNLVVAVIDTGIDYMHEDLAVNMWVNPGETANGLDDDGNGIVDDLHGARWINGDGTPTSGDPMDGDGHGTHVAGTIGGVGNNGVGVAGVNWNVRLMALKFLDDSGSGWTADAVSAVAYAVSKGARLSNNSWGGGGFSQAMKDAIDLAAASNQLFVAAAGNSGTDNDAIPHYPSSYASSNIIAVASSDRYDDASGFSCYGKNSVHLAAPGSEIYSSVPGDDYDTYNGTSMASPHVAGACALLWSIFPDASAESIKAAIVGGASRKPAWANRTISGGRLNVEESVRLLGLPAHVVPVENFSASSGVGEDAIQLSWGLPVGAAGVVIHADTEGYPAQWGQGRLVYEGVAEAHDDESLVIGDRVFYSAWARYDDGGVTNYSAVVNAQARVGGEPDDYFTEWFDAQDHDLSFTTVTFRPSASLNAYEAFADSAISFPVDPSGGTVLDTGDDDYVFVELTGETVPLYDQSYAGMYVGANGYITFESGDTSYRESLAEHFRLPRVSGLFDDLDPSLGGTVSWKQLGDRAVVTYEGIPEYGNPLSVNNVQIELFFSGVIRITWLEVAARDGLAGLSAGEGVPFTFVESDLSGYPSIDPLRIQPRAGFVSSGLEGGPFVPASVSYAFTNAGDVTLTWELASAPGWLDIAPVDGSLDPGFVTTVVVTVNASAESLPFGQYDGSIVFSNATSGKSHVLPATLRISREGHAALYFVDGHLGEDYFLPALYAQGYQVVVADSWDDFNEALTNDYLLAVALAQFAPPDLNHTVLADHIGRGGRVVIADWTQDADVADLLEGAYSGSNDLSPAELLDTDLAAGVSQPLALFDPGYGLVWSMGLTPTGEGQSIARYPNNDSALVWGNEGRTALLGFLIDTVPPVDAQRFFENLLGLMETGFDDLRVSPAGAFVSSGYELGPFAPEETAYLLYNAGVDSLVWSASATSSWIEVATVGGTLGTEDSLSLTVRVTAVAHALPPGVYRDTLTVTNATSGKLLIRSIQLSVLPRPGEIAVYDSIAPTNDLQLPFGEVTVGLARVETVTVYNADATYDLLLNGVYILSAGEGDVTNAMARTVAVPSDDVVTAARPLADLSKEHVAGSLLVGFTGEASKQSREQLHAAAGVTRLHRYGLVPVDVVSVPAGRSLKDLITWYEQQPGVAYAEPNYIVRTTTTPDDPRFGELWGLENTGQLDGTPGADIRAVDAWAFSTGSSNVIVAVIDTGIDYTHEDLVDTIWLNPGETENGLDDDGNGIVDDLYGARWVDGNGLPSGGDPMDGNSHGTHVAGTIGASGNNGVGVAGVNWSVRLMALKFLSDGGSGSTADAISAIEYAINKGAHLSNNSWGGGGYSQALKDAIDAAGAANQLFIAAAGNSGTDNDSLPHYPSSYASDNIVAVASSDRNDQRSSFSCFGATSVDLAAPGSTILSTTPGDTYSVFDGTSMATPHVAGAAALLLELNPGIDYATLKDALMNSVDRLPVWDGLTVSGGRLNLVAALGMLNPHYRVAGLPALPARLAPGESLTFQVTYAPVEPGEHEALLVLASNDTNAPMVEIAMAGTAVPDTLVVTPEDTYVATGYVSEAVSPGARAYTLLNGGDVALGWTVAHTSDWLSVSTASGTMAPSASTVVTASVVQAVIETYGAGSYRDTLIFSNSLSGVIYQRAVRVEIDVRLCDAVDACDVIWSTGGAAAWVGQEVISHDGVDAARSGVISDGQLSWLETEVTGPGRLSFWWKVSSEPSFDYLQLFINGDLQDEIDGEVDWQKRRYEIVSGVHTVRWHYVKDGLVSEGQDQGWLDEVVFAAAVDALDHAGLYTAGTLTNQAHRGAGFEPWEIAGGEGSVADLASSTSGSGNINSTNGTSFRFYGGPSQTYVDAIRPFAAGLNPDDVFRVTIAYNWNGGARGVSILAADYSELANINFGGGADTLSFKWGGQSAETLSTSWSSTATLYVTVVQLAGYELEVTITRNDGASWTRTSDGLWAPAGMVKFYNGGHPAGNVNYALFANDVVIERAAGPDSDGDGLPDWWEQKHFGGLAQHADTPAANPAYSLREMFIADLDPTDPAASFPPADAVQVPGGLMHLVIDPSSTARVYRVQASTNLLQELWPWYTDMKTGTGGAVSFVVTNDAPVRIYRTGVGLPE